MLRRVSARSARRSYAGARESFVWERADSAVNLRPAVDEVNIESHMNHRWGDRISVDIEVHLVCAPQHVGAGRLDNVSMSGAFVFSELRPPLLSLVRVIAVVRTAEGPRRLETRACVVRHAENGIGLEWLELAPQMLSEMVGKGGSTVKSDVAHRTSPLGIAL